MRDTVAAQDLGCPGHQVLMISARGDHLRQAQISERCNGDGRSSLVFSLCLIRDDVAH
jgi:hypothetical protein